MNKRHEKKIKVCHIATVAGSLYVLLKNQLIFLRDNYGYEVHGAAAKDEWVEKLRDQKIPVHVVTLKRKYSPLMDLKAIIQLYSLFKKEKFHIVHVHTPKAALLGSLAAWLARIPIRVNTIHGFYFHEHSSKPRYYFFLLIESIISRCVHHALSQNKEDYFFAIKNHMYKSERISYLGNGIDISRFKPDQNLKKTVRLKLGIPLDSLVIGIVGRLTDEKGHREFLKALSHLHELGYPVKGIIIGRSDKKNLEFYLKLARNMGIEENVQFLGWRDNIEPFYCAFDVFVLPSYREGYPRSAMEACACGIPCVLTDIRGCREVVKDGVNGFLVPVKRVQPLVEKIRELLNNQDLRIRMGKDARNYAEINFNESLIIKKMAKTYDSLLKKNERAIR